VADVSGGVARDDVLELIKEDKLREALAATSRQPLSRSRHIHIALLKRQLAEVETTYRNALVTSEEYSVRRGRIAAALLDQSPGDLADTSAESDKRVDRLYRFGNALLQRNDFRRAIRYFNKVLRDDRTHIGAHIERGAAQCALGKYEKAIADFTTALELDGQHPFALFNRGVALWHSGRRCEACSDWRKVKALGFDVADAYLQEQCTQCS